MLLEFIHWNVDPAIFHIGSFGIRYYSLGFLFAFVLGYYIMFRMFKREKLETDKLDSLVIWMFLSVLIGARLGHCLFYEPDYFLTAEHWPEIFLPIQLSTGRFVGYQGLASHGAAIAVLLAIWLFCRKYKFNGWWLLDRLVIVVALGGAFIRLGNLFNSEIYGVETSLPWGFIFERNGETLPKHPTQLYESLSYFIIFAACYITYLRKNGQLHKSSVGVQPKESLLDEPETIIQPEDEDDAPAPADDGQPETDDPLFNDAPQQQNGGYIEFDDDFWR